MNRNAILWMAYSTDFIDAERALNYGLVSNVVDADKLDAEVDRFCELLISRPRPQFSASKNTFTVHREWTNRARLTTPAVSIRW